MDFRKLAGLTLLSYIDHHGRFVVVSYPIPPGRITPILRFPLLAVILCIVSDVFFVYFLSLSPNYYHYHHKHKLTPHKNKQNNNIYITGVTVRPEAPPSELAVAVARHFEHMEVDEEECIGGFLERLEKGCSTVPTDYTRQTAYYDGHDPSAAQRKRKRSKWAARQGEHVAAKVTRTDENGSWILASVQRFYPDTETYDVQDEDDTSKLIRLPWSHVMRLSTGTEGCFRKHTDCMAIFPETTSFYRAKVSKSPAWNIDRSGNPVVKEIIVQFEDDEDNQGRTPHRRVPSRYVIPIPQDYFYDEAEEMDPTTVMSEGSK